MTRPKYLLYSFLLLMFFIQSPAWCLTEYSGKRPVANSDCSNMEAEVKKYEASLNRQDGKLEVRVTKGESRNLKFIWCKDSGEVINEGAFQKRTIEGLVSGTYYCIIVGENCHKKIKITL